MTQSHPWPWLSRFVAALRGVTVTGACLSLAAMVMLVVAQVVSRVTGLVSAPWTEEFSRYLFVWSVYLGTFVAFANDRHIRVTFLTEKMSDRATKLLRRVENAAILLFGSYVVYQGILLAATNRGRSFYTLDWAPQIFFYLSLPVCFMAVVTLALVNLATPPGGGNPD